MQWLRRQMWMRQWLMASYVLATALLGFAHHAVAAPQPRTPVNLSDYTLPDGSLPSFCLDDAGRRDDRTIAKTLCDACLLTAAGGLVAGDTVPAAHLAGSTERLRFPADVSRRDSRPAHVAHLRGPPVPVSTVS